MAITAGNNKQQRNEYEQATGEPKSSNAAGEGETTAGSDGADKKAGEKDPKIINNIVHIDQKGANINITNVTNHQTFVIYANR